MAPLTIVHIGKEANRLEDVHAGLVQDAGDVSNIYDDRDDQIFRELVVPVLSELRVREVARRTGYNLGSVHQVVTGKARPHRKRRATYIEVAAEHAAEQLRQLGVESPAGYLAQLSTYCTTCGQPTNPSRRV